MALKCMFLISGSVAVVAGESLGLALVQLKAREVHVQDGSLPPMPANFPALANCSKDKLSDWQTRSELTGAFLQAWKAKRSSTAIVQSDAQGSCLLEGDAPSRKSNAALTLVKEPEVDVCITRRDFSAPAPREPESWTFPVLGSMARSSPTRRYQIIWPNARTCNEKSKCPVLFFFHGCGRSVIPYDQMLLDRSCAAALKSVIVVPWLDDESERWTEGGAALEEFVVPLWHHLYKTHAGLDETRVTVAGASLGSGMALQAGLLHPEIFSAVVAGGVADGSHCAGDDPHSPAIPYDSARLLSSNSIPTLTETTWRLKLIVLIMGEKELSIDEKVTTMLDMLDSNGVSKKTALHLRLYGNANHPQCSIYGFNQWLGMHEAFWTGVI